MVIGYAIVAVVTYASTWLANRSVVRRLRHASKTHRQLHLELKDDIDVNIALDRALQSLGPGTLRCFLSRIHNGDSDIEMRKKTRTHEQTARGIEHQSPDFRAIPTSRVTEEMELVIDDGVTWREVSEIRESLFKELCERGGSGSGSVARVAVKFGKEIIGFVGADFSGTDKPVNVDQTLATCARDVSRILSRYRQH